MLEDFGVFIAPAMTSIYGHLIPGEWKTIDVIAKADGTIHSVVRERNPGAKPSVLHTIRRSADEVVLIYGSPRKMCAFAIGIAMGVAKHYNETIEVTQTKWVHNGAPRCEIVFCKKVRISAELRTGFLFFCSDRRTKQPSCLHETNVWDKTTGSKRGYETTWPLAFATVIALS